MNKVLYIILISLFSLTIISCSSSSDGGSSTTSTTTDDDNSTSTDTTAPVISGCEITTPTNDNTPDFIITSSEAGTVTFGGSCSSSTTSETSGTNTITFNTLSDGVYSDCTCRVTDSAGNASNVLLFLFLLDSTAPTVSSVTSSTANGTYRTDDNITLTVTFSEQVTVDNSNGNPIIQLETGSTDRNAIYSSGSGTDNLSLIYTVVISDNSTDLGYKASNSLGLNSGTIRDSVLNDAVLTLPNPGSSNSLSLNKAIVINTTSIFGTSKFDKSIFGP